MGIKYRIVEDGYLSHIVECVPDHPCAESFSQCKSQLQKRFRYTIEDYRDALKRLNTVRKSTVQSDDKEDM